MTPGLRRYAITTSSRLTWWDSQPGGTGAARLAGPDEQVGLGLTAPGLHDGHPAGVVVGLGGRAGQQPVTGEQVVDLARHLKLGAGEHDEEVGDPLELGDLVRGEQHRDAVVGHRGHHRGQEVLPGDGVERGQRLIQDEQPRPSGQRQREREL